MQNKGNREFKELIEKVEQLDDSRVYVTIDNVLDNNETTKVEEYFNEKYDATTSVGAISNQVKKDITKTNLCRFIHLSAQAFFKVILFATVLILFLFL